MAIEEKSILIALRDGLIRIGKLRLEKSEKAGGKEFAQLAGLKVGDRFGE